jgi:dTDP-glucose 4,6-dehydratase
LERFFKRLYRKNNKLVYEKHILVTGGAGFIGSHLVRLFVNKYPEYHIINMDVLTYAGNLENLKDIEHKENYTFVKCDICDFKKVKQVFKIIRLIL